MCVASKRLALTLIQPVRPVALVWALAVLLPAGPCAAGDGSAGIQPLDCVINPSVVADLGSGAPGILDAVRVDRSDLVEAGEVIAELDAGVETASVELANARAEMDTEVRLRRVNAAFGGRQQERSKDLFQRKVISTNDMDERQTEAQLARIQLRQALDNMKLAKLELHRSEQVLRRRTVVSPITGVVMEKFRSVGEYVDDTPIVRVAQLDPLHVEVFVPVEHLGQVRPGMRAQVNAQAVPDVVWQAEVARVDRVADIASGTYGVRLILPNPDYRIPAGLRCLVRFPDPGEAARLTVAPVPPPGRSAQPDQARPAQPPTVESAPGSPANPAPPVVAQAVAPAVGPEHAPPVGAGLPLCLSAGPFDTQSLADQKAAVLRAAGLEVVVDARDEPVAVGFKVVSGLLPDRARALAYVERLAAAGVEDLYLPKRAGSVRVALGLYKVEQVATQRVRDLAALGFDAEIVPWREPGRAYFLGVQGKATGQAQALLAELPVPATEDAVERGDCEALASR